METTSVRREFETKNIRKKLQVNTYGIYFKTGKCNYKLIYCIIMNAANCKNATHSYRGLHYQEFFIRF